jgi:hypothetical protein
VGGRYLLGEGPLRLWIEHAHQSLGPPGPVAPEEPGNCAASTFQTEEQFWAILVGCSQAGEAEARRTAGRVTAMLEQGTALDTVVEALLVSLPEGEHMPISILRVVGGTGAQLVECDAPPLFLTRRGGLVLLPVVEDVAHGRLVRRCQFSLQEGDYLAVVSEGYIHAAGWDRRWGWRDIALSIRRLTDTGCDAEQLLGALLRMYHRLARGGAEQAVTVVAMHVRPLRSATVWSGPPADPGLDGQVVERLLAEPGRRIICGDTTAAIAARALGVPLEQEPRPEDGWAEVPATSRLRGVDLVTEGVVTLRKVRERIAGARRVQDLPRAEDGATRLARLLLAADVIRFIVGRAVNPAQTDGGVSWRQGAIEKLVVELRARGKIVSVEYLDG